MFIRLSRSRALQAVSVQLVPCECWPLLPVGPIIQMGKLRLKQIQQSPLKVAAPELSPSSAHLEACTPSSRSCSHHPPKGDGAPFPRPGGSAPESKSMTPSHRQNTGLAPESTGLLPTPPPLQPWVPSRQERAAWGGARNCCRRPWALQDGHR